MQGRAIENKYRNTVVCIDSYKEKILNGRLYNPYLDGEVYWGWYYEHSVEKLRDQIPVYEDVVLFAREK